MGGTIHTRQGRCLVIIYRLDKRSRMNREIHVWICGSVGVKFPCATRPDSVLSLVAAGNCRLEQIFCHDEFMRNSEHFCTYPAISRQLVIGKIFGFDKYDLHDIFSIITKGHKAEIMFWQREKNGRRLMGHFT